MNGLSLRIFGGELGQEFNQHPILAVGNVTGTFQAIPPTLVDEDTSWMMVNNRFYTLYAHYSKTCTTHEDKPGQLLVCLFVPDDYKMVEKSPLEALEAVTEFFISKYMPDGLLSLDSVDDKAFADLLDSFVIQEKGSGPYYYIMEGSKPAAFCVDSLNQLKALTLYSSYPVLASISRLEIGMKCPSTINIPMKVKVNKEVLEDKKTWHEKQVEKEREKAEKEKAEKERLAKEKKEKEEKERIEREKAEKERLEQERGEQDSVETEGETDDKWLTPVIAIYSDSKVDVELSWADILNDGKPIQFPIVAQDAEKIMDGHKMSVVPKKGYHLDIAKIELDYVNNKFTVSVNVKPVRRKWLQGFRLPLLLSMLAVLLFLVIVLPAISRSNRIKAAETEAYNSCLTIDACRQYLKDYPFGRYHTEVEDKLQVFVKDSTTKANRSVMIETLNKKDKDFFMTNGQTWLNDEEYMAGLWLLTGCGLYHAYLHHVHSNIKKEESKELEMTIEKMIETSISPYKEANGFKFKDWEEVIKICSNVRNKAEIRVRNYRMKTLLDFINKQDLTGFRDEVRKNKKMYSYNDIIAGEWILDYRRQLKKESKEPQHNNKEIEFEIDRYLKGELGFPNTPFESWDDVLKAKKRIDKLIQTYGDKEIL